VLLKDLLLQKEQSKATVS